MTDTMTTPASTASTTGLIECLVLPGEGRSVPLPERPGHYLWHVADRSYMAVGMVRVVREPRRVVDRLQSDSAFAGYIYPAPDGSILVLYHEHPDSDRWPTPGPGGRPEVDGYIECEFCLVPDRAKHEPKVEVVRRVLKQAGRDGLTDEELERATGFTNDSVRNLRRRLVMMKMAKNSGKQRKGKGGRNIRIWVATDLSDDE